LKLPDIRLISSLFILFLSEYVKIQVRNQFLIKDNVKLYGFDAEKVPNYQEYLRLKKENKLEKYIVFKDVGSNLVVNEGLNFIRDIMTATTTGSITYSHVGSGTTAVSASDTALATVIDSRLAASTRYSGGNGIINIDTFYTAGDNNGTWAECGLFSASSGGSMIARRLLTSTFTKSSANSALLAWTITMTSS